MRDELPDRDELAAWLRLLLSPGLGPLTQRRLLAAFGLPQQVFTAPTAALSQLATTAQIRALRAPPPGLEALVARSLAWLAEGLTDAGPTRRLLTLADADYPPALLATEDPPLLLHAWGRCLAAGPLAWPQALAVVGSRNATPQGLGHAQAFASHLAATGWTIVSGLALGIDGAAHEGALAGAAQAPRGATASLATIAVLGTGLDRVYPRAHEDLARRIAERGLLLSEFTLGTPPLAENFPRRNRLIAALSRGTLVVEAATQSGSLITAGLAAELGREVFAIPGSVHAPQSRGCHALIRQGAQLVETAQDILEALALPEVGRQGVADHGDSARRTPTGRADAESLEAVRPGRDARQGRTPAKSTPVPGAGAGGEDIPGDAVLGALGWAPASLDALLARTGLPTERLLAHLLDLELAGQVGRLPGGLYQRQARA